MTTDTYPFAKYYTTELVNTDKGLGFWQDLNYQSFAIDLMVNLTNLFRSYPEEKQVDFIPYLGGGFLHGSASNTNPVHNGMVGKIGMRVNFNLGSLMSVYIDPQANFVSTELDGYVGNRSFDVAANVMVGLQFNINKNFANETALSMDEINYLNKKINDNRTLIEGQQNIIERQQALIDKLNNKAPTTIIERTESREVADDKLLPGYIYFGLDSHSISYVEQNKINAVINYLRSNPDSKLLLIGYADRKTGNKTYNLNLSRRRVDAVVAEMNRQGIDSRRLLTEWRGDREQPFAQNDWNRVVVMVERK
jgi:outer membrane protein OmpA-like peptidoglycan-associated protein